MRAFFFCNQYLAGIHPGIQSGHALDQLWSGFVETMGKHTKTAKAKFAMLREFSKNHKTWICLNGGDSLMLGDLYKFMIGQTTYPFTMFQEPGLNYANTAVVIILPERMYDDIARSVGKALLKGDPLSQNWPAIEIDLNVVLRQYTPWEREFLKRKEMCGLAS
jgi:hypothetical protein